MPITYVNDFNVIRQNDNMCSINAALTVDLTGQVASESIGHTQYSATAVRWISSGRLCGQRGPVVHRPEIEFRKKGRKSDIKNRAQPYPGR
jgi:hypothetical protein